MEKSSKILGFISYVAVACVGVAMFVQSLLKNGSRAAGILLKVAYYAAFFCIALSSFLYCIQRRRLLLWIIWGITMVLLVLGCFVL